MHFILTVPPPRRLCFRPRFYVCLLATSRKNYSTEFRKIRWKGGTWVREEKIRFWWSFGSRYVGVGLGLGLRTDDMELVPKQLATRAGHTNWLFLSHTEDVSFWTVLGTSCALEALFFCNDALYKYDIIITVRCTGEPPYSARQDMRCTAFV